MPTIKFLTITFILFLQSLFIFSETPSEKGYRLAVENDAYNSGYLAQKSEMQMILVDSYGKTTERKMISIEKEGTTDGDLSLFEFIWPLDVKGVKLLTHSHIKPNVNDDQWLYLPALGRIKRINSRNQTGSFQGSEFSYEDIAANEIEKFTYQFIRDDIIASKNVWVTERYSVNKKSGYSKQVTYVDKMSRLPLKIEYFDRKGDLLKIATFSEFKQYKQIWFFDVIDMINVQTRKSSKLVWKKRITHLNLSDAEFSKDVLTY